MASLIASLSFTQLVNAQDMDHTMHGTLGASGAPTTMNSPMPGQMTNMSGHSEILSVLETIDADEIVAAKKAQDKKISKQVSDYAKMMIDHHTTHIRKTKDLQANMNLSNAKTPLAVKTHKENNDGLARILKLDGRAFDKAYITLMMKGHAKALDTIKKKLMPMAKDDSLKKFLTETSNTVTSHLTMAQKIRKNLK